mmetsp:Transcript_483/g.1041  ORF Transcript_483/g.1041 Transcript_483/m.1041 type:complete len:304 (-) Transcript_483:20-931(-)
MSKPVEHEANAAGGPGSPPEPEPPEPELHEPAAVEAPGAGVHVHAGAGDEAPEDAPREGGVQQPVALGQEHPHARAQRAPRCGARGGARGGARSGGSLGAPEALPHQRGVEVHDLLVRDAGAVGAKGEAQVGPRLVDHAHEPRGGAPQRYRVDEPQEANHRWAFLVNFGHAAAAASVVASSSASVAAALRAPAFGWGVPVTAGATELPEEAVGDGRAVRVRHHVAVAHPERPEPKEHAANDLGPLRQRGPGPPHLHVREPEQDEGRVARQPPLEEEGQREEAQQAVARPREQHQGRRQLPRPS